MKTQTTVTIIENKRTGTVITQTRKSKTITFKINNYGKTTKHKRDLRRH